MSPRLCKRTINSLTTNIQNSVYGLFAPAKRLLSAFFIVSILLQSAAPAVFAQEKTVAKPVVEVSEPADTTKTADTSSPETTELKSSDPQAKTTESAQTQSLRTGNNTGSVVPGISSQNSQQQNKPKGQTDQSSGAFTYDYPFNLTQGRNGLTPDVALSYNSQNSRDGIAGFGWALSLPSIERINKRGVNKLYTQNDFSSSFSGELVKINSTDYVAKIDNGQNLKYTFSNPSTSSGSWTITDKSGNTFVFSAGLQNPSAGSGQVARWYLTSQADSNGNTITYTYTTDTVNNEILISNISYAIYRVDFSYEARPDQKTSYEYGFQTNLTKRLKTISLVNTLNSQTIATLTLNYVTGANGKRSLLSSITESRQGTTLPATTFSYENAPVSFATQSSWNVPNSSTGAYIPADINGDGLVDISVSTHNRDGTGGNQTPDAQSIFGINTLARNNGNGTFSKISDIFPATWGFRTLQGDTYPLNFALPKETGVRLIDVNGDFMPDLLRSIKKIDMNQQISKVSLNNYLTSGMFGDFQNVISAPLSYIYSYNACNDYICETQQQTNANILGDINGDGLIDMVNKDQITYNTGAKWDESAPVSLGTESPNFGPNDSYNTYFADINGDGLDDQISWSLNMAANNPATTIVANWTKVKLNTGTEFIEAPNYQYNVPINTVNTNYDNGIRFKDMNGDGLPDLIHAVKFTNWMREQDGYTTDQDFLMRLSQSGVANGPYPTIANTKKAYLNTGTGWDMQNPIELPEYLVNYNEQWSFYRDYRDIAAKDYYFDVDGDGMTDYLNQKNTSKKADVMKTVTSSEGATTSVAYKNTPTTGLNPQLPTAKYVVDTISTTVNGQTDTTSYTFENGKTYFVDSFDRGFAGFGKVTVTHGSKKTISLYHQNDGNNPDTNETGDDYAHKGLAYQTDVTDLAGNLYARTYAQYTTSNPSTGSGFTTYRILKTQEINEIFPGNTATRKGTATQTSYDVSGNPTQIIDFGEVNSAGPTFTDTGSDKATTVIQYAISGNLTKPSETSTTDQSGSLVSKTKYFYDSLANGQISKGNKTKEFNYKDSTNYIVTKATYNSYGLPVTQTDANNNQTTIAYDANSLYPTTVTNPKGHITSYVFNTNIGKPSQITDPNNNVSTFTYDGFGRLTQEQVTDPETNALVTKTIASYVDTPNSSSSEVKEYLDASTFKQTITYFDGALRPVQIKTSNDTQWSTVDTTYDNQGRIQKQSLPYFTSTSTPSTGSGQAGTSFAYDVMDREIARSTSVGTTVTSYNLWTQTVTDPKGNAKTLELDARGNLVKVVEMGGGVTTYGYNLNQNLIKQTDANGNIRNFTFDLLGRQTLAEDFHAPSDTTFGTRTATYDNNGNVLTFVNGEN